MPPDCQVGAGAESEVAEMTVCVACVPAGLPAARLSPQAPAGLPSPAAASSRPPCTPSPSPSPSPTAAAPPSVAGSARGPSPLSPTALGPPPAEGDGKKGHRRHRSLTSMLLHPGGWRKRGHSHNASGAWRGAAGTAVGMHSDGPPRCAVALLPRPLLLVRHGGCWCAAQARAALSPCASPAPARCLPAPPPPPPPPCRRQRIRFWMWRAHSHAAGVGQPGRLSQRQPRPLGSRGAVGGERLAGPAPLHRGGAGAAAAATWHHRHPQHWCVPAPCSRPAAPATLPVGPSATGAVLDLRRQVTRVPADVGGSMAAPSPPLSHPLCPTPLLLPPGNTCFINAAIQCLRYRRWMCTSRRWPG